MCTAFIWYCDLPATAPAGRGEAAAAGEAAGDAAGLATGEAPGEAAAGTTVAGETDAAG